MENNNCILVSHCWVTLVHLSQWRVVGDCGPWEARARQQTCDASMHNIPYHTYLLFTHSHLLTYTSIHLSISPSSHYSDHFREAPENLPGSPEAYGRPGLHCRAGTLAEAPRHGGNTGRSLGSWSQMGKVINWSSDLIMLAIQHDILLWVVKTCQNCLITAGYQQNQHIYLAGDTANKE